MAEWQASDYVWEFSQKWHLMTHAHICTQTYIPYEMSFTLTNIPYDEATNRRLLFEITKKCNQVNSVFSAHL